MNKEYIVKEILSWIIIFAIALGIARLVSTYIVLNADIPSGSMEQTIMTDDRLLANKLAYINGTPQRGDIVVFKYPVDESELFIKRVIGLPNEKVEIIKGRIYINDSAEPLDEGYLPEEWTRKNDGYVFEVPQDSYLMMGDNRNLSSDARDWAKEALRKGKAENEEDAERFHYVKEDKIVAKAMLRYWPLKEISFIKGYDY